MNEAPRSVRPSKPDSGARIGTTLNDRYALEAKIGEGGMGEVWRARHLALENPVAIKFLTANVTASDEVQKRFLVEAKVTAQLKSRHAVQVFDFGVTGEGHPYLVMELLHGETLKARIERVGRLDAASTVHILRAASKALVRAHSLGIIHRDFKPDNIFLTKNEEAEGEDEVKVVDFGVAKLLGGLEIDPKAPSEDEIVQAVTSLDSLTRTGRFVGTPHYMSPEQIRMSAELGPAADIWALGVVAFECLTGKCPFDGTNVLQVFAAIQLGRARSARALVPSLPVAFETWFARACGVDPATRFADAIAASNALADALLPGARRPAAEPSMTSELVDMPTLDPSSPRGITMPTLGGPIPRKPALPLWGIATIAALVGAVLVGGVVKMRKPATGVTVVTGDRSAGPSTSGSASTSLSTTTGATSTSTSVSTSTSIGRTAPTTAEAAASTSALHPSASPSSAAAAPGDAGSKPSGVHTKSPSTVSTNSAPLASSSTPDPKASTPPPATAKSPFALPPLGL